LADELKRKLAAERAASGRIEINGVVHDVTIDGARFNVITAPLIARLRRPPATLD
jgi:hypothetical protein